MFFFTNRNVKSLFLCSFKNKKKKLIRSTKYFHLECPQVLTHLCFFIYHTLKSKQKREVNLFFSVYFWLSSLLSPAFRWLLRSPNCGFADDFVLFRYFGCIFQEVAQDKNNLLFNFTLDNFLLFDVCCHK